MKYRRGALLFYLGIVALFSLVHFLAGLPMPSLLYSVQLAIFILIMALVVDYLHFRGKMKQLGEIRDNISSHNHGFPRSGNVIEERYQEIIAQLYKVIKDSRWELESAHAQRIEYFTMWVHQIKTPIAALGLALDGVEYNSVMGQELFKIEQYAEMALNFVKLDNLQEDMIIGEYRVEEIVRDSIKKYASLFILKKLSVTVEDMDAVVSTDSKWLSFVIEQLLANAIKYTQQGGVEFSWQDNTLIIQDSGRGISGEDIERIFEKGYTGYNGRLDKRATGIGLYMAKKVADRLSIQVQITSQVGVGTRASLRFPQHLDMPE